MERCSEGLCTLLGYWLKLATVQKEAIQQRAPVETLQEVIGIKEKLKAEIVRVLTSLAANETPANTSLLEQILQEEKQAQELLAGWLGEIREEIARVHQGQEALQAYFKAGSVPTAHFFDKRR
ncbi:hypothetical protein [Thermodesulfitimonas sp.]